MRCTHCGVCCAKTEMLLSSVDITQLEGLGYCRQQFVRYDRRGFARLRNRQGVCVFYDVKARGCRVYAHRPLGCRVYPVIYSEQEGGVVVDDMCPMHNTVSARECRRKGKQVIALLQRIDDEAHARSPVRTSVAEKSSQSKGV